ncbi:MAG TPA: DegT/DnrJ/EryC1/StrS family aminotransferase [Spirochaetota bacterium]|nr:DegT/DnrJ/EryC1/StrS family aminotransferase [Spirochaetota bacterium]HOD14868.1 DegT/DnrJ/EryC1/StrS family aminotransferase [Spirochaetota bacterium]HPG49292.1 DegT/DnrJ/EryC1/StrS family aminotransferase [Spirochaetota bacterium]HPN10732.1 DegT/DnrJ/EryC1/StrS family aminotransferase [Spirochaetota bacterium]HQL81184.1 DegT/DnrJ/EryC1/StrS family aminotransferase [Spirochaetota bacterium]
MNVPFHKPYITEEEVASAALQLREGWLTAGSRTVEFERAFRDYVGCGCAVAVNSATAALHLALAAIGLKEDDEVLVPGMTFTATAEVARYFRAWPVLVDIERDTHNIDPDKIEEKITGRTRAIMPMHFAGQPCDMDEICAVAKRHGIAVIEDAAHCMPSWYRGRKVGALGDMTCFSFYATKTMTTGEGGMLCTDNAEWARTAGILRLHGIDRDAWERVNSPRFWQYDVVEAGYKYNTTDIASAIGLVQLKNVETIWEKRKRIAERYGEAFGGRDDINPVAVRPDRVSSWYLYTVDLNLECLSIGRDEFIGLMRDRGIGLSVHFIPLYEFTYYKKLGYDGRDCPNCAWVFDRTVSLPIFPGMTDGEIDYVIGNVTGLLEKNRR